jgi:hypothetical protein
MLKGFIDRVKKKGVKVMFKIPLEREIPMHHEREPGDFVCKAVEVAITKSLLRRAYDMLSVYQSTGSVSVPDGTLNRWLKETRHHLGK